jgi:CDP-diacylglycerol---glycerol-3-phosphate 3-phosphatidyltransferase
MIEGLKPFYNRLLRPLVILFVKFGVSPNHLTLAGLVISGAAGWFVYKRMWTLSLILFIAGSLLDGLDGAVARENGKKSAFGAILDSCCDRLTEIVLLFGVLSYFLTSPIISWHRELSLHQRAWGILFCYSAITMSLMVSYVKARCEGAGVSCSRGFLQRPERIILLCVGLFLGPRAMVWILGAITLLAGITVVQRVAEAYRGTAK